jgi:hypothetical protein
MLSCRACYNREQHSHVRARVLCANHSILVGRWVLAVSLLIFNSYSLVLRVWQVLLTSCVCVCVRARARCFVALHREADTEHSNMEEYVNYHDALLYLDSDGRNLLPGGWLNDAAINFIHRCVPLRDLLLLCAHRFLKSCNHCLPHL